MFAGKGGRVNRESTCYSNRLRLSDQSRARSVAERSKRHPANRLLRYAMCEALMVCWFDYCLIA